MQSPTSWTIAGRGPILIAALLTACGGAREIDDKALAAADADTGLGRWRRKCPGAFGNRRR